MFFSMLKSFCVDRVCHALHLFLFLCTARRLPHYTARAGDITVGRTIAEAWFLMDNLHKACDVQVDAAAIAAATGKPLKQPPAEVLDENFRIVQANYTGSPYGELEWLAIKRRMEKRMGPGYKDM